MTNKEFDKLLDQHFSKYRSENKDILLIGSKFSKEIGSTRLEDIPYHDQLNTKLEVLKLLFDGNVNPTILEKLEVYPSPHIIEYRFKVEFVTSFNPKFEPHNRFGQRKKGNFSWVVDLDEYVLIEKGIFLQTRKVYDYAISLGLSGYDLKKNTGDLRYITVKSYLNESMLLLTSSNRDPRFEQVMEFALEQGYKSVYWLINDTLHDSFEGEVIKYIGKELLTISVKANNTEFQFLVGPFTFFQNNIYSFELILEYINKFLIKNNFNSKTLYDLYCGVGLLGIVFANRFNKVIGIEIVRESIDLALKNLELNNVKNAHYSVKDIKEMHFKEDLNSVVIVDPPRNGLEDGGIKNLLEINPEYIIYISCNPVTLNKDLKVLKEKYQVLDLKSFDTFPQTYHLESLCIMQKI